MSPLNGVRPDPKPTMVGGIGRPKPKRGTSRATIAEIHKLKAAACRCCPNAGGLAVHAHHLVRRGAPHFGEWVPGNIVGLCVACHDALHRGDDTVRRTLRVRLTVAEVAYADARAYRGYVDDRLWRVRSAA